MIELGLSSFQGPPARRRFRGRPKGPLDGRPLAPLDRRPLGSSRWSKSCVVEKTDQDVQVRKGQFEFDGRKRTQFEFEREDPRGRPFSKRYPIDGRKGFLERGGGGPWKHILDSLSSKRTVAAFSNGMKPDRQSGFLESVRVWQRSCQSALCAEAALGSMF